MTFWAIYALMDILLSYTWIAPYAAQVDIGRIFFVSTAGALISLISKVILTYGLLNFLIPPLLSGKASAYKVMAQVILLYGACIVIYRLVGTYIIAHHVYIGIQPAEPLFTLRSVIVSIIDLGFVAGLAVALKILRIQLAAKDKEKMLIREKLDTELKFLKSQTHPHFLMNTLNNIYGLARKNAEDTAEVVLKLSELLRFMLYESDVSLIPLSDEIKVLEDYLELEMIRYNERLTVSFEKEVDSRTYHITPLLLLPLLENAFKHGVSESRFNSYITIDLQAREGNLYFSIENSKEETAKKDIKPSIGLPNIRRQLELTYRDYSLQIVDEQQQYVVFLKLNLTSHVEL